MPPDEEQTERDDRVLEELAKLHEAWRNFRDTVNYAIGLLNTEVFGFQKRVDRIEADRKEQREKDDQDRITRTAVLDTKLAAIESGLNAMRTWQYIRVGIEVAAILIITAAIVGKLWL